MMTATHDDAHLLWIDEQLKRLGVYNYRFCVENDCYLCDINGSFYSVCTRQLSKAGNLIEKYSVKKLNGSIDRYGYLTYRVLVNGEKKHLKAHRMMLNAWIGEQPNLVVNHIDGNKKNNALSNLEWCTVAENNKHAIETGLFTPQSPKPQFYAVPTCDWMPIYILNKHLGLSYCELGRRYRCCHTTISKIINRIDRVFQEVCNE